jgi:hypothetical protein
LMREHGRYRVEKMVDVAGLEPATPLLAKQGALPTELHAHSRSDLRSVFRILQNARCAEEMATNNELI